MEPHFYNNEMYGIVHYQIGNCYRSYCPSIVDKISVLAACGAWHEKKPTGSRQVMLTDQLHESVGATMIQARKGRLGKGGMAQATALIYFDD